MGGLIAHRPTIKFPAVTVYTGNSAVALTQLDLSAYTGGRRSLVLLRFYQNTGGTKTYKAQPWNLGGNVGSAGLGTTVCYTASYADLMTTTDSAGSVGWAGGDVSACVITLQVVIQV